MLYNIIMYYTCFIFLFRLVVILNIRGNYFFFSTLIPYNEIWSSFLLQIEYYFKECNLSPYQGKSGSKVEMFMISFTARHLSSINKIGRLAKGNKILHLSTWDVNTKNFLFALRKMKKNNKTIKSGLVWYWLNYYFSLLTKF